MQAKSAIPRIHNDNRHLDFLATDWGDCNHGDQTGDLAVVLLGACEPAGITLAVQGLSSESSYWALVDSFGIRRTHPSFWTYSNALQDAYTQQSAVEAALLDYNRLENR